VTILLTLLYIGQVYGFAIQAYYALSGRAQVIPVAGFDRPISWVLKVILLLVVLWSLEAIRKWNKLGFVLYVTSCAISLALEIYALLGGFLRIGLSLIGPITSPLILWIALQLGSPSTWQQMGSHNLLRDLQPRRRVAAA
jgi:hypothetical protein